MISSILSWLKGLFTRETVGILLRKLVENSKQALAREIFNPENQQKAYEFVKKLREDDTMSNRQKAEKFNLMMLVWAQECGKVLAESVINCLREMAVNVIKDELLLSEGNK